MFLAEDDMNGFMTFLIYLIILCLIITFAYHVLYRINTNKTIFDYLYILKKKEILNCIEYKHYSDTLKFSSPPLFLDSSKKISFIIPITEPSLSISERFTEIESNIYKLFENDSNTTYEIIIVNDNCVKSAELELFDSFPNVHLISFNKSLGRGFSILIGGYNANGDVLIIIPFHISFEQYFNFLIGYQEVVRHDYNIVIPSIAHTNFLRKERKNLAQTMFNLFFNIYSAQDPYFDCFIISRFYAQIIFQNLHFTSKKCFNYEFLVMAQYLKLTIIEKSINVIPKKLSKWYISKDSVSLINLFFCLLFGVFHYKNRNR